MTLHSSRLKERPPERPIELPLDKALEGSIQEARTVIPGVQALLGFQLVAVFNQVFVDLPEQLRICHFAAICLNIVALTLLLTPAAFHRAVDSRKVWDELLRITTLCISIAMVPLMLSVVLDCYVVASTVSKSTTVALLSAASVLVFMTGLWFVSPRVSRSRNVR